MGNKTCRLGRPINSSRVARLSYYPTATRFFGQGPKINPHFHNYIAAHSSFFYFSYIYL